MKQLGIEDTEQVFSIIQNHLRVTSDETKKEELTIIQEGENNMKECRKDDEEEQDNADCINLQIQ